MVHGLDTIKRLNAEAVRKAGNRRPETRLKLPEGVALSPAALRRYANTPWTKEELRESGQPDVYKSYERSAAGPFRRRECETEGARA